MKPISAATATIIASLGTRYAQAAALQSRDTRVITNVAEEALKCTDDACPLGRWQLDPEGLVSEADLRDGVYTSGGGCVVVVGYMNTHEAAEAATPGKDGYWEMAVQHMGSDWTRYNGMTPFCVEDEDSDKEEKTGSGVLRYMHRETPDEAVQYVVLG